VPLAAIFLSGTNLPSVSIYACLYSKTTLALFMWLSDNSNNTQQQHNKRKFTAALNTSSEFFSDF